MRRVIIGTAGHVDHGKTSLIKALTGVDCDRLKEEKERGLTIELGFTSLALPSGEQLGIVDVPGHVKFLKHMLSGATGIDLMLLVVAADEGIMPQTAEHTAICALLGVKRAIVALTKIDMVDEDMVSLAATEVKEFLSKTVFMQASIIPISSITGQGIKELVSAIEKELPFIEEKKITGIPSLPIDRAFIMKGFGVVVTGTLSRGKLTEGQDVEILPVGIQAKIRGLQVHSRAEKEALAGMRTAINLQGVSKEDMLRGQWVVPRDSFSPTHVIDARLSLTKKPKRGGVRIYIGTAEALGFMNLYEVAGEQVARIRLKDKIVAAFGDRFILREISPVTTIGGGIVLNPYPRRRFSEEIIQDLLSEDWEKRVYGVIKDAGIKGISKGEIFSLFADTGSQIQNAIEIILSRGEAVRFDAKGEKMVNSLFLQKLKETIVSLTVRYQEEHPSDPGIPREHLRSAIPGDVDPKLFYKAVLDLAKDGKIEEIGSDVRSKGFNPGLGDALGGLEDKVYGLLIKAGFETPSPDEISESLGIKQKEVIEVLKFMARQGKVEKIKEDIYLADKFKERLKAGVEEFLRENQSLAPADMKVVVGVSRKYGIPFLEYLDRIRFTVRMGNARKLAHPR